MMNLPESLKGVSWKSLCASKLWKFCEGSSNQEAACPFLDIPYLSP